MSNAKISAKAAARHLRAAAKFASQGGRRTTMAPLRRRATLALREIARALAIAEAWDEARQQLARKRGLTRRAEKTIKGLGASPTDPKESKP